MFSRKYVLNKSIICLFNIVTTNNFNVRTFNLYSLNVLSPKLNLVFRETLRNMAGTSGSKPKNRLADEKSPYLLQHATNPVDWYPWGTEAISKAHKEQKLIFLSVGYSTCHWCHVMERESFENDEIAKIMNDNFICVKVDREERPDVDKLYMTFVQAMTGGGGWPMSVWLTPQLQPVYGGTYFPPKNEYGRPGFATILGIMASQWNTNKEKFTENGAKVMEVLKEASELSESPGNVPGTECIEKCFQQLTNSFENKFGGFGSAPKFPQPVNLNFLLHYYSRDPKSENNKKALDMCKFTLKMMANGGIHDHISQGFARYSTDGKWHVPHFEKMLYDQGQLVVVYSEAFLATKDIFFGDIVRDILTYVNRDLSHKSGGFYSAEDADSLPTHNSKDKKEGAFCVWTQDEINHLLDNDLPGLTGVTQSDLFCHHYNVKETGNVSPQQDPHNELTNQNVLIVFGDVDKTAEKFGLNSEQTRNVLEQCRVVLHQERLKRPRPHLDDKMLTSWNGLMISGFAKAGQALDESNFTERAVAAAKFIKQHLYNNNSNNLLRSCYTGQDGQVAQIATPIDGFLDDYAFLIRGLLDLYEATFDCGWIAWSETLQETQDRLFWDESGAGYYTSPAGDPSIVVRMKEDQDGAEPSGNSVSAQNLLRLSALLDRPDYKEKAEKIFACFNSRLSKIPVAVPEMTSALMSYHDTSSLIYITGRAEDPETAALLRVVQSRLIPGRVLILADGNTDSILYQKNQVIRGIKPVNGRAAAYVCRHHTCSLPVTSVEELTNMLDDTK